MMKLTLKTGRKLAAGLAGMALLATAVPASAHPGHGLESAAHGLLHVEHILTLLAVIALLVAAFFSSKR